MTIWFVICARRLYESANKKFGFEQFVLLIEAFKIFMYMMYNFVLLHLSWLIICEILQCAIQFVITLSFMSKVLIIAQKPELAKWVKIGIGIIFSITILISIVSAVFVQSVNCNKSVLGEEWLLLIFLSLLQSVLIVTSSIYLTKKKTQYTRSMSS